MNRALLGKQQMDRVAPSRRGDDLDTLQLLTWSGKSPTSEWHFPVCFALFACAICLYYAAFHADM